MRTGGGNIKPAITKDPAEEPLFQLDARNLCKQNVHSLTTDRPVLADYPPVSHSILSVNDGDVAKKDLQQEVNQTDNSQRPNNANPCTVT